MNNAKQIVGILDEIADMVVGKKPQFSSEDAFRVVVGLAVKQGIFSVSTKR